MDIQRQKERLLIIRKEIETELSALGRKISPQGDWIVTPEEGDGNHADALDEANVTEDFEEKIAVLNVLEERYEQVNKALKAIELGTYGICSISGEKISEQRLEANPSATTCIKHAE